MGTSNANGLGVSLMSCRVDHVIEEIDGGASRS